MVEYYSVRCVYGVLRPLVTGDYVRYVRGHGFLVVSRVKVMDRTVQRGVIALRWVGIIVVCACVWGIVYGSRVVLLLYQAVDDLFVATPASL